MFGFKKSPAKPAPPPKSTGGGADFFDSDDESDKKSKIKPARRTSSEPVMQSFDDQNGSGKVSPGGDLDSMSMQELEGYAVNKAEDTTSSVNNCLKIAEDIKGDASKTLEMLHQQGEQITRTHQMAADMDKDLSKGEKLLNNLGGMFSKPWKPKKTRQITGPLITSDKNSGPGAASKEQKEKLTSGKGGGRKSASQTPPNEPMSAMQKVELEKAKQDDALSDLSNVLGDLKSMATDMGSELDTQNKALDHMDKDVDEINSRVKGANQRARRLVGK